MLLNKVLVVGGSGFIGSRLMKTQPDWRNVDLKNNEDFCKGVYLGYDAVIMLAAKHVGFTEQSYAYNLKLYEALARTITANQDPFVVFVSSAAVYEPTADGSHQEDEFLRPATLYGRSKVVGEQIVQDMCKNYAILRLSNVYGDGDGHGAIDIFKMGGNIIYGDGQQVRDYIYVDKVVTAINRIIASPQRYLRQTYNVSTGLGQTTENIFNLYGHGGAEYVETRDTDIAFSILDNIRARQDGLL